MGDLTGDEAEAITAASDAYVSAMNAEDWQRVAQSFTEDAVRIPPHEEPHTGRGAIEKWLIRSDPNQALAEIIADRAPRSNPVPARFHRRMSSR